MYKIYVTHFVFDFMHDEFIIMIVCCQFMTIYNLEGMSNAYIILSHVN